MRGTTRLLAQVITFLSLSGCACDHWSLTSDWHKTSKVWRMDVCDSWLFEGMDRSATAVKVAEERANELLENASMDELHSCAVVPDSLRIIEGPITSMTIRCKQSLVGVDVYGDTTPKQYVIQLRGS